MKLSKKGFTLIEVVVAVFITIVVLAVFIKIIGKDLQLLNKASDALKKMHVLEQVAIQLQKKVPEEVNGEWEDISYNVTIKRVEEYEMPLYKICVCLKKKKLCFLKLYEEKK